MEKFFIFIASMNKNIHKLIEASAPSGDAINSISKVGKSIYF